jgi:hypothetical protein
MVLSSRDRIPVSVEDRLALPAERRRLRFSFQINDVKDPTGSPAPPFCARWRRRAACLVAAHFHVNQLLKLFRPIVAGGPGAKAALGRQRAALQGFRLTGIMLAERGWRSAIAGYSRFRFRPIRNTWTNAAYRHMARDLC